MYCITSKVLGSTMYLGWQNPVWDADGYFWTYKNVIKEILCNNTPEHPFLFSSKREAYKHLHTLHITQTCKIIKWTE